jgi:hypothetical protein
MGIHLPMIKCDNCGTVHGAGAGPNWTPIPSPVGSSAVLLSCVGCGKIFGAVSAP